MTRYESSRWGVRIRGRALIPLLCTAAFLSTGAVEVRGQEPAEGEQVSDSRLVLGGTTYDVRVRGCNLTGDDDSDGGNTLNGTATGPDGEDYVLEVSRTSLPVGLSHAVTLFRRNRYWAVDRMRIRGRWTDGDGPLIRIDGRTVTADGVFEFEVIGAGSSTDSTAEGRLRAICPE